MKEEIMIFEITREIINAAKEGQILPNLSILLAIHFLFHNSIQVFPFNVFKNETEVNNIHYDSISIFFFPWLQISQFLLWLNLLLNLVGYSILSKIYRNSVENIFNRELPLYYRSRLSSWGVHLMLLRPLEMLFRYMTSNMRVLPDVIVLGEVRCGTTTICQHLSSLPGCHPPFCPWKHPELDNKESFYFVGHYIGNVTPRNYRMCFPLKWTKWFHTHILNKPFFTFDGCAQYLTSPSAPYLIAKAYQDAGQKPPVLIACVRDPVDQTLSWWRYENNAMVWGSSMGLSTWNHKLRTKQYPPISILEALQFSSSPMITQAYDHAENYIQKHLTAFDNRTIFIPPWAMTWPGGQLTGIGRNSKFADNIQRYERIFKSCFSCNHQRSFPQFMKSSSENLRHVESTLMLPSETNLQFVNVIPMENLTTTKSLNTTLSKIMHQVVLRNMCQKTKDSSIHDTISMMTLYENVIKKKFQHNNDIVRRNPGTRLMNQQLEPSQNDIQILADTFENEIKKLEQLCHYDFGWNKNCQ